MYCIAPLESKHLPCALEVIHKGFMTIAKAFELSPYNCPTHGAFMPLGRLQSDFDAGNLMYGLYKKEGGAMIGFVQLAREDDKRMELKQLCVLPNERHGGGGAYLLNHAKQAAARQGAQMLTLGIIEENTVLKNWYRNNGFSHLGTKVFEHLPFTVGLMACNL